MSLTIKATIMALILSAGLLSGLAGTASATPTAAQQAAIRSACPNDFRSFCSGVSPGGAEALQCLEKNVAKLSSACQSAVQAVMPGASSTPSTDSSPTTDSSATTESSEGSTSDADAATPAPAVAEPTLHLTLRQEIFLVREACGPEFRAYCGGIQLGGGNAVNCLRAHSSKLSGACKGASSDLMR
jgi:hypothetical protein